MEVFVCSVSWGVGAHWQNTVQEYRSLEKKSVGHVRACRSSSVAMFIRHSKKTQMSVGGTAWAEPRCSVFPLKPSVRHAFQIWVTLKGDSS